MSSGTAGDRYRQPQWLAGCEPLYCTSFPRRHDIFATFPALLTPVQWAKYLFYKVAYQTVRSPISLRSVFLQLPVSLLSPLTFALAQMIPTPKISVSKHPRQLQEWFNICDLSLTLVYTVPVSPCWNHNLVAQWFAVIQLVFQYTGHNN